jgi:hypothetical protein
MPRYTMRRAWPDDPKRPDDYVFRVDGHDAGRCYLMIATYDRGLVWRWTVYGTRKEGMEATLDDAKAKFKIEYEKVQGAG